MAIISTMPTMLTIEETSRRFSLPKHFVRQAVLSNKVVHVKAGKKYLINAEKFIEWLNTGEK